MKITIPIAGLECRWWHALPALALLGAACAKREAPPSQQQPAAAAMAAPPGPAPPAPLHCPQGKTIADVLTDAALRADLVSQAAALNYDTSLGAADRRYLAPETPGGPAGPYGEIAPEFGAAATSHADAVRGRVFGRIYLARA